MKTPTVVADARKAELERKLAQIEADEIKLKVLEEDLHRLQSRMAREASPLVNEFCDLRVETLTKLKTFLTDPTFKKKEKRLLVNFMLDLAVGLQAFGDHRAEAFIAELLPPEPEELREEKFHHVDDDPYVAPKETKPEVKSEIKSLFRQLAKAFHPDREPLEHLKEEKTNLMKKITDAYERQDLSGLLRLEKDHLGEREFSEDKIEQFIKHVGERLKELKAYRARLTKYGPLSSVYQILYSRKTTILEYNVQRELLKLEEQLQSERDLQSFIWDRASLKDYLK